MNFKDETGDDDFIFEKLDVPYKLDPPILIAMAEFSSNKLKQFSLVWDPQRDEFSRSHLIVRKKYRGQGIGSTMNKVTESIAKKLACKKLVIQAIVTTSQSYWRNKPDYAFDGDRAEAVKVF